MGTFRNSKMKIITVNLTNQDIEQLESKVGEEKNYTSRSEVIRIAVRQFLAKLISKEKNKNNPEKIKSEPPAITVKRIDDEEIISFPSGNKTEVSYKILKK